MRNTLGDLNNHLFAQLERLSDEDIKGEELEEEMKRAKSVAAISKQIISNGQLVLRAQETAKEWGMREEQQPRMLKG